MKNAGARSEYLNEQGMIFGAAYSSGAVVPNATATVENVATNLSRTATSSATGTFRINDLPIGVYKVSVAAPGFKTTERGPITLEVDQKAGNRRGAVGGLHHLAADRDDGLQLADHAAATQPGSGRTSWLSVQLPQGKSWRARSM